MSYTLPTGAGASTRVMVHNPGPPVPDGDGGWVQTWTDSEIPWYVAIAPAMGSPQERTTGNTVEGMTTSILTGKYRPDVSTASRLTTMDGATFEVLSVASPGRRGIELTVVCNEVVSGDYGE